MNIGLAEVTEEGWVPAIMVWFINALVLGWYAAWIVAGALIAWGFLGA